MVPNVQIFMYCACQTPSLLVISYVLCVSSVRILMYSVPQTSEYNGIFMYTVSRVRVLNAKIQIIFGTV